MKISFYDFVLDTNRQTLHYLGEGDAKAIELTKINFEVLLFFIQHPKQVITKDQLIEEVWAGKLVTDNSIDQSISKIRKSLADLDQRLVIKTVYGKGYEFVPGDVQTQLVEQTPKSGQAKRGFLMTAAAVMAVMLWWQLSPLLINEPKAESQQAVIWLNSESDSDWLNQSSHQLINQVFAQHKQNYLLNSDKKPNKLTNQQFIENYWRINPELEVVSSTMIQNEEAYTLTLNVATKAGEISEQFNGTHLLKILTDANQWLAENSHLTFEQEAQQNLIPNDPHVLELHLRSINAFANGQLDQALSYALLATDKEPMFGLAQLSLAQIQYAMGDNEASLATLDTIQNLPNYAQLNISEQSLRGDILDTSGQHQQAVEIYQQLLDKYPNETNRKLLPVLHDISFPLMTLHRYDEALAKLDQAIAALHDQFDLGLLADVLQRKGSILLQVGRTDEAKEAANLAYQHYNNLSDLMGSGKVSGLLARIANHEADYQQAIEYLQRSLNIYKNAEFPLGVGAALNELIYIQVVNGQFDQAWTNMQAMQQIAREIDYFAMIMAAKQHEFEIARGREQWLQAESALTDYFHLSTDNDFSRGLFKHQLFELDLAVDQGQSERAKPIIKSIQAHINNTSELRLQPRLNIQQAKVYFLDNKTDAAIKLLHQTKALAAETNDMESIHEINNELLQHHINTENYTAAEAIIENIEQQDSQPQAYPFLLLKSKTHNGLGDKTAAVKAAEACKKAANQNWRPADERYLSELRSP